MCYSAMIEQSWREYARTFNAQLDWEEFLRVFHAREKDLSLKIPSGIGAQLIAACGPYSAEISRSIARWHPLETQRIQAKLVDIDKRIAGYEAKKTGVTRDRNLASARRNRMKTQSQLEAHLSPEISYRIWPANFAPVLTDIDGRRLITPMRYRVIPRACPELDGMYNARRERLRKAKPWIPIFGKQHGIFFFQQFFESVTRNGVETEITFKPDSHRFMWAPAMYEETQREWGTMRTFAIVTDEPPPEVAAAGHNRCPIFLNQIFMEQWLHPAGQSLEQLNLLLDHRESTYYSHTLAA